MWIEWAEEDAHHIATRSRRYPDALDVAVEWTQEAVNDERAVLIDPYPRSRVGAAATVGFAPSAGRVLVVLAHLGIDGRWHGRTAWPATGRDLALWRGSAMTQNDVPLHWEQESRADARRIEDEVVADPDAPYPTGVEHTVSRLNRRSHLFTVRLSADEYATMQRVATARHLPASTLARAWLLDRLADEQRAS